MLLNYNRSIICGIGFGFGIWIWNMSSMLSVAEAIIVTCASTKKLLTEILQTLETDLNLRHKKVSINGYQLVNMENCVALPHLMLG